MGEAVAVIAFAVFTFVLGWMFGDANGYSKGVEDVVKAMKLKEEREKSNE